MKKDYERLKQQLQELSTWPSVYMFKFIVPADNQKIAKVQELFNTEESEVRLRKSKNGKYVSITAKELMLSPDSVVERYKRAEGIEGLISL